MTLTATNLVRESPSALRNMADQYRSAIDRAQEGLDAIQEAIDLQTNTAPLRDEQRQALFALYSEVFGSRSSHGRYVFTKIVLGKDSGESVSWSTWKAGSLTVAEASKVLTALSDLKAALR